MNKKHHRFLCAFCALLLLLSVVFPAAAFAEQPLTEGQDLTADDAAQMQQADDAVTALTDSDAYTEMDRAARQEAALAELQTLVDEGLVQKGSIHLDEEHDMVSFTYSCGVLGGVLLKDLDEENAGDASGVVATLPPDFETTNFVSKSTMRHHAENNESFGKAVIYYAFDNTINSSRYPYYSYMKGFWTAMGLDTTLNTNVTVADLKKMDRYDMCILSAHGSYYTYTTGRFFKKTQTKPIVLLTEESNFSKDLKYGFDLLGKRIIKVNGRYCVTADFFRSNYRRNQLKNTIVYSETCEFLGVDGSEDDSMADALLAGGAKAVIGYVNNVYTVYSRSMLWDTVNHLIMGQNVGQALQHAKSTYGEDDLVWYHAQGGLRPHAAASYAVLYGSSQAMFDVPAYAVRTSDGLDAAA